MTPLPGPPALHLDRITLRRSRTLILDGVSLRVEPHERWVLLGRNGSGKTTLLRVAALTERPSSGTVEVLGERLGNVDVRRHRRRIGVVSPALGDRLRPSLTALDAVVTALHAALEPWWHRYDDADRRRALDCLEQLGVGALAGRELATLSSGERQRVLIARTLMTEPGLLLLDEPTASLDLTGREQVIAAIDRLAADASASPIVLVSHHVEEIPASMTHAALLVDGRILAAGPIDDVISAANLQRGFDIELEVERGPTGRFRAWAPG